jgi:hypothetical protein
MLHSIGQSLLIFFTALGLIAFRLLWPSLLTDKLMLRHLPTRWQEWLFDKPRSSAERRK